MAAMAAERKVDAGSDGSTSSSGASKAGAGGGTDGDSKGKATWCAEVISGPFKEPPRKETCAAVRICVQELIQPVLKQMEAWTNDERCQAASTLHTLIIL
eukprot:CAMPEP_0185279212 /NCGR_PEP_ID=MMETSP1359-20130426/62956_1 /TAXON_ID=552665 /ORGANISM="Bigelowiella longifila, Strain CCMP242" /LENGTH=99 /DNA_ID=CAMNT_0027874015 /DNA_START=47 /DNA_END=342 /DNA_ORIENTATION=+